MPYITFKDLDDNYNRLTPSQRVVLSSRAKAPTDVQRRADSRIKYIFLSHSHKDRDIIEKAIYYLLSQDSYVYVDWMDDTMPASTTPETAAKIRQKIQGCDQFAVLSTKNSAESKWVPWELGFADGKIGESKIVIYPIAENTGQWIGAEYLGLYRHIRLSLTSLYSNTSSKAIVVSPKATTGIPLQNYLNPLYHTPAAYAY